MYIPISHYIDFINELAIQCFSFKSIHISEAPPARLADIGHFQVGGNFSRTFPYPVSA
jgi:hypothetical protein